MPQYDSKSGQIFAANDPRDAPTEHWLAPNSVANALLVRNAAGAIVGGLPSPGAAPVQAVAASAYVISVGSLQQTWWLFPCTVAAAASGTIIAPGLYDGQEITVVNRETTTGHTITTDATPATSHVALPSVVIAIQSSTTFIWDAGSGLWYPMR